MTKNLLEPEQSTFDVGGDPQDTLFDVLSHPYRRFTLQYLEDAETPLPVEDLSAEITWWEVQRSLPDRTTTNGDAIETGLVHTHLPKMDDAGVVDYDRVRQTVALADDTADVHDHLDVMTVD